MPYLRRLIDDELDQLFPHLAAVAIDGAKGVGKTATAERRARSVFSLDQSARRAIVAAEPAVVLAAERPALLDEWQLVPGVWDVVRRQVDDDRTPGQFLLTGSATPAPGATAHSGAGRIVRLRMRPMALCERAVDSPTVSLRDLLTGANPTVGGSTRLSLPDYVDEIVRSGFPGLRDLADRPLRAQLDAYIANIVDREIPESGRATRKPQSLLSWLRAYAAATSTTASYGTILDAATPGEADKPARSTVAAYRDVLSQLWLLDPLPGWLPTRNHLKRLQQAPKHHLADPALAARLLRATPASLLHGDGPSLQSQDGTLLGSLFESLAVLSVRSMAQAAEADVAHLRTGNGDHEIDMIVIGDDGKVVAIEVKLSATITDRDVKHLRWLRDALGPDLLDSVVINTGPGAYRRDDGIAVIPLSLLGP